MPKDVMWTRAMHYYCLLTSLSNSITLLLLLASMQSNSSLIIEESFGPAVEDK